MTETWFRRRPRRRIILPAPARVPRQYCLSFTFYSPVVKHVRPSVFSIAAVVAWPSTYRFSYLSARWKEAATCAERSFHSLLVASVRGDQPAVGLGPGIWRLRTSLGRPGLKITSRFHLWIYLKSGQFAGACQFKLKCRSFLFDKKMCSVHKSFSITGLVPC